MHPKHVCNPTCTANARAAPGKRPIHPRDARTSRNSQPSAHNASAQARAWRFSTRPHMQSSRASESRTAVREPCQEPPRTIDTSRVLGIANSIRRAGSQTPSQRTAASPQPHRRASEFASRAAAAAERCSAESRMPAPQAAPRQAYHEPDWK